MTKYCKSCGEEIDDDSTFCINCGTQVENGPKPEKDNKNQFIQNLPLILAIFAIAISIIETLGTPMLMGLDYIIFALLTSIIGGSLGIILMKKFDEPLVTAIEFILIAGVIYISIGRFGEISTILYIIAAILTLYFEGTHINDKKIVLIPIATVIVAILIILVGGLAFTINAENSVHVGNITQSSEYSYGYYESHVRGDVHLDTSFDYLCVNINFYDAQGKIIESIIGWNELNPQSGRTYTFDGMYFGELMPAKAEIIVTDSSSSTNILYTENITLN